MSRPDQSLVAELPAAPGVPRNYVMIDLPNRYKEDQGEGRQGCPVCRHETTHSLAAIIQVGSSNVLGGESTCRECGIVRVTDDPIERSIDNRNVLILYLVSRMYNRHRQEGYIGVSGCILIPVLLGWPLLLFGLRPRLGYGFTSLGIAVFWLLLFFISLGWFFARKDRKYAAHLVKRYGNYLDPDMDSEKTVQSYVQVCQRAKLPVMVNMIKRLGPA